MYLYFYNTNKRLMYLRENIKYPKEAEQAGAEGTVIVDFVINKNGQVRDALLYTTFPLASV